MILPAISLCKDVQKLKFEFNMRPRILAELYISGPRPLWFTNLVL